MKKIFFLLMITVLFISCGQNKKMKPLQTHTFGIANDVYIEGYSDSDTPFLYYATNGTNMVYKYYLDSGRIDSIDLEKKTKINYHRKYSIVFAKENFVLYHYFQIYNSLTGKVYSLDSLSNFNDLEYSLVYNNVNPWKGDSLLIGNNFTCRLLQNQYTNREEALMACRKYKESRPSYSVLDFKNNQLNLSTITLNDIRPNPTFDNDLSTIWFRKTSIFVNDVILYNNHYIDTVYEIDEEGKFDKAFTIKSKYTEFDKENKIGTRNEMLDYAVNYATKVDGVLYDKNRNKILVVLVHGTKDIEKNGKRKSSNRPFSILVYNQHYELENEYLFDDSKYNYHNVYVCKDGVIINANNKLGDNYEPQKLIYEVFTY